ncbi:MAG: hypothetical protein NTW60_04180 [Candidatus Wolfebacteria bacterium]|nr:hypothetical protein [Candidatus Wolfebacteria bacterium]
MEAKSILEQQLQRSADVRGTWPWKLLLFSVILFGMSVFIYSGIAFGYQGYLDKQLGGLNAEIKNYSTQADSSDTKSLITFYSQLVNIQSLLQNHPMPSKVFSFLESHADQNIYFMNSVLSVPDRTLRLDGRALEYDSLIRELEILKNAPEIRTLTLSDSRTDSNGNVQFTMLLSFNPGFYSSK